MLQKERLISNIAIAYESVRSNTLRSLLTALGIIFGVAAVITMLAIGTGAQKEILSQMELIGANNIIIHSVIEHNTTKEQTEDSQSNRSTKKRMSNGLSLADAQNILQRVPGVKFVSPEIIIESRVISNGMWKSAKLIGINNDFFNVFDFKLRQGRMFSDEQLLKGLPVCLIGSEIRNKLIRSENPIGQQIKCNDQWLTVVGVLESKEISEQAQKQKDLGIRDYNTDIYIPVQTMLVRFVNRSLINQDIIVRERTSTNNSSPRNYHELDKITVKIEDDYSITDISEIISRILKRRHVDVADYNIVIPELLLQQQQKAKRVFSIVLSVIAGISLLVGGIGIMNIMLATVLERIREIGLRIALGAKQIDIVQQFLFEAVIIGVSGGIIGIVIGIIFSVLTQYFTGITTIISLYSIVISFFVAIAVGLVFGIVPAKKAAKQDPISSLRHE